MAMEEEERNAPLLPPRIRRLEESVVNRIAAGEVIQRPASALKELIENSLDAGATSVDISVKDGGLKLMKITDNGHGIRHEDLPLLCERHTTSKLKTFEDLQKISTLGFRGEALASISFVSHLTVTTMAADQTHGYRATYKDGILEADPQPCAALKGTQIMVENLFYNVAARRKAFKNPSEEYARTLDVISRFAIHRIGVSFSCKKHGEGRSDVHTVGSASQTDAIRAVYGPGVARELIHISVSDDGSMGSEFKMEGYISSANYSAKKTTMVLFINDRLVECAVLKKAIEVVYAAILPKASKPFIYMSISLPFEHVDVNVHPTKKEVTFLNQESLVESIQKAVELKLMTSNTTRTFYTQAVLPGAPAIGVTPEDEGKPSSQGTQSQKTLKYKLVRTDSSNPAGRMHAYLQKKTKRSAENENENENESEMSVMRRAIRQRRNPKDSAELTSVQEMEHTIDQETHAGLHDIVKQCSYIGMADDILALVQHKTRLFLLNIVNLSKELMYQQVIRRFARFNAMRLTNPAPLHDLILMALDEEELCGRWHESDGSKDEIAKLNTSLLMKKSEMLREYFLLDIDEHANLCAIPVILDQYTPDMDRLPHLVLTLSNCVDWESEKECFETLAAALANFYASHPPLLPNPFDERVESYRTKKSTRLDTDSLSNGFQQEEGDSSLLEDDGAKVDEELVAEAEAAWTQREWSIEHVLFPAMKLFLKPPKHMANDGTAIQIACLENLYKIFERC